MKPPNTTQIQPQALEIQQQQHFKKIKKQTRTKPRAAKRTRFSSLSPDEWKSVRYFAPKEVANLMGFPQKWSLPGPSHLWAKPFFFGFQRSKGLEFE